MAKYELKVDGVLVLQRGGPMAALPPAGFSVSLVSLERSYDAPAKLMIRLDGNWRRPPWRADRPVELFRNDVRIFEGLTDLPQPVAAAGDHPAVEYACYDRCRLLGQVMAETAEVVDPVPVGRRPNIHLSPGRLSDVTAAFLQEVSADLVSAGVSHLVDLPHGVGETETFPVSIDLQSIDRGMRLIAAAAPGVKVFLNPAAPGRPQYTFVPTFTSPVYSLSPDERRVLSIQIRQSIEGRYGAVQTLGGQTQGQAQVNLNKEGVLTPAWDPELEKQWSRKHAWSFDANHQPPPLAAVFRKFSFADVEGIGPGVPMRALVLTVGAGFGFSGSYEPATIVSVDFEEQTLWLDQPALLPRAEQGIGRFNPNESGRSRAASVFVQWSDAQTGRITIYQRAYRFPETGFAGRAWQLAPLTCGHEKFVSIPGGVARERYAQYAHAALSEPLTEGAIELNEELPDELWLLDRRLNVASVSHGPTGYEQLLAPVLGVRNNFAGGGTSVIEMSRDTTALLKEGSA